MASADLTPIDLLVSDIDGTLVRDDKSLSEAVIAAVARLQAAGKAITLVSSRPPRALLPLVQRLGIQQPVAGFNGGNLVQADGTLIRAHRLAEDVTRQVLERLEREAFEVWLFADDLWLTRDPEGPYVPRERRALGYGPTVVESFEPYLDRVDKIVAAGSDHAGLEALEGELGGRLGEGATVLRSQLYYLDITHPKANKGDALIELAQAAGVPVARTAAIGDGSNDVPMFRQAGLAIAMGQAGVAVREAADQVTASNQEDGVAVAIDRWILGS
ncbi:hydrolase [Pseudomonas oryzihabitans]|nr:hydrolase [Pseudomonas psychrotolerans]KTT54243.1 hydrolase [Pseudomonas psychrotolerans]